MGEGDDGLAAVGGDELVEELGVDLRSVAGQVAGLRVAPRTTGAECRDFGAELRPRPASGTMRDALPMEAEGADFGVAAIIGKACSRASRTPAR